MLRVAMCDDDAAVLEEVAGLLQAYAAENGDTPLMAERYVSPLELCKAVENGKSFDIFLLDVEMPELSGLKAAGRIRGSLPGAVILFLTSHTEFPTVQEGYKVGALRYICKLELETALPEALKAAISLCMEQEDQYLTLTWHSQITRIPLAEIIYLCRASRMVEIHTANQGIITAARSLGELFSALNEERFFYSDRSTIVNMDYVLKLSKTGLVLKTGEELPVSRLMMPKVKAAIMKVWGSVR